MDNRDEISGNKIPPGALAEEVRDDIPILASVNEYIIPANVVRYIGLEKIERMVAKAREELGDDAEGDDDLEFPFDENELEGADDEPEGFAEGGSVDTGFDFGEGNGVKQFKNDTGQIMFVPFMNGEPLFNIPDGYVENSPNTVTPEAPNPNANVPIMPEGMESSAKENQVFVDENESPLAGDPNKWGVEDFLNFGEQRGSVMETAMKGLTSMMPLGKLAFNARESWLDSKVSTLFDTMLETGMDPNGNPISDVDMGLLRQTKENLKTRMSEETGLGFSPIDTLTSAVKKLMDFTTGGNNPASSLSPQGQQMTGNFSQQGDQYSGGTNDVGGGMGLSQDRTGGQPSEQEQHNAETGSGGLYARGGLITRR